MIAIQTKTVTLSDRINPTNDKRISRIEAQAPPVIRTIKADISNQNSFEERRNSKKLLSFGLESSFATLISNHLRIKSPTIFCHLSIARSYCEVVKPSSGYQRLKPKSLVALPCLNV